VIRKLAALMALLLTMAVPACAQDWKNTYGGNGIDSLTWMIPAGDGLLVAGHTTSTDGDLSGRTRSGKAGWLLCLDGEGKTRWSVCTAHVGRCEMKHPCAHADSTFSAILTETGEGSEWLRVSSRGKVTARIETPSAQEACMHGGAEDVFPIPYDRAGEPVVALLVSHEDGTRCCSVMNEAGIVSHGVPVFSFLPNSAYAVCGDGLAAVAPVDGAAQIQWIVPGGTQEIRTVNVPVDSGRLQIVLSVLPCADGSVIFSGQLYAIGSVVMRVNAEGETLFVVDDCENYAHMTLTDTGFAGIDDDKIVFYDEDGTQLGFAAYAPQGYVCAIAALSDGAAVLEDSMTAVKKPCMVAAVTHVEPAERASYPEAVYTREYSTLKYATADGGRMTLYAQDRHGVHVQVVLDESGALLSEQEAASAPDAFPLPSGTLFWKETALGASVSLCDRQGKQVFETVTPIHTAADRLEWLCAAELADGSYLLGGRYLTRIIPNTEEKQMMLEMTGDGLCQEAVLARLSRSGVLLDVTAVEDKGCAAAIAPGKTNADTMVLYVLGDKTYDMISHAAALGGGENVLDILLDPGGAYLLRTAQGIFAAGTNTKNGRATIVVQPVYMQ